MASITNELESIAEFIEPLFAGADVHYQQVPVEPKGNVLAVRYMTTTSATETNYHFRLNRDFQIVYFAKNEFDCLLKFEKLERHLNNALVIPIKGTADRYLRVDNFAFSQPFKTEAGKVSAMIGVLSVHLREARDQVISPKIAGVDATTYAGSEASTFDVIEGENTTNPNDGFTFQALESGDSVFNDDPNANEGFTFDEIENGSHIFGKKE